MLTLLFLIVLIIIYVRFHYKIYKSFFSSVYTKNGFLYYLNDVSNGYIDIKRYIDNDNKILVMGAVFIITAICLFLGY
ncbi:hypothetical protein [Campylobacter sputorum]|uniref:hypothetical protein n=1 Tax=Campylobacter sputorum TaxID=206 RepID=UPI001E3AE004|nr:hypothetical protein [Campylobacter sputorum]